MIYTLFTLFFNFVDIVSTANFHFLYNFWYIIYAIYAFGKLMEGKNISTLRVISFISVLAYAAIYFYTLTYQIQPFPDRKYPLYDPNPVVPVEFSNSTTNSTLNNGTETSINSTFNLVNQTLENIIGGGL